MSIIGKLLKTGDGCGDSGRLSIINKYKQVGLAQLCY